MSGTCGTCGTCKFWLLAWPDDKPTATGLCRFGPPQKDQDGFGRFPLTTKTNWCGKHKAKGATE